MKRFVHKASQLSLALLASVVFAASHLYAVDTMESLIAGAKKEDELVFIAGAQTFGGRKGLAEIEGAFNKRYGLTMKISFAAGPDMNARAARHITEIKSGRKVSMEIFPGETVLTYTSPNGIVYNKDLIPKDKAPKNYADLIDPKLSPTWAGKI